MSTINFIINPKPIVSWNPLNVDFVKNSTNVYNGIVSYSNGSGQEILKDQIIFEHALDSEVGFVVKSMNDVELLSSGEIYVYVEYNSITTNPQVLNYQTSFLGSNFYVNINYIGNAEEMSIYMGSFGFSAQANANTKTPPFYNNYEEASSAFDSSYYSRDMKVKFYNAINDADIISQMNQDSIIVKGNLPQVKKMVIKRTISDYFIHDLETDYNHGQIEDSSFSSKGPAAEISKTKKSVPTQNNADLVYEQEFSDSDVLDFFIQFYKFLNKSDGHYDFYSLQSNYEIRLYAHSGQQIPLKIYSVYGSQINETNRNTVYANLHINFWPLINNVVENNSTIILNEANGFPALGLSHTPLNYVVVASTPNALLKLNGIPITENQSIPFSDVNNGNFICERSDFDPVKISIKIISGIEGSWTGESYAILKIKTDFPL